MYKSLFSYEHVDTEFGISKKGDIRLLQSRPVVELDTASVETVDQAQITSSDLVVQGLYSLLGAVHGKCKIIKDFDALTRGELKIGADDILVAAKTSNYWN